MKDIISYKDNTLYFDGVNTVELAAKYGTPLYVQSETDIVAKCDEIHEAFLDKYPNTRAAYAVKALSCLAILKIVEREGLCIEVVSGGELYAALKAGFPPERIEFTGNNKLPSEIELAADMGIGRIIIDGLQELALIEKIYGAKEKKAKVLYRITPGVSTDTHAYISTGKKDSKFGIPLDDDVIYPAIKAAIDSDVVDFKGLHFHVGSQLFDNSSHLTALETLLTLVAETKSRFAYDIQELNIGGGFGIEYTHDQVRKPYSYFLDPVMERIGAFASELGMAMPAVVIEPGRSIVGEGGLTLYTIGSIKDISGVRKYVSVDGGMSDNIRVGLYEAKYEGLVANKAESPLTQTVSIAGKCCESTDILIKDISIPDVEAGDIFATFATGAYGYSMANNYNKNNIPALVLVKEGRDELIAKRQSYDQMLENEIIPASLIGI